MNNHIQLVLKSSTTEMSLNDHDSGIYIVPELEGLTGLPSIRTTSGVNAGYDGGWTSAQNFDARSITIRGVIASTDVATVERMRKQLIALLAQGKNEPLTLNLVTEAGNAYELEVRTIACEMAMQTVLQQQEFLIQLRADDPLIYDSSAGGESVLVQVQHAIGGFEINFELPLAISGGEGESIIENAGLEKVYPVISMYGALHNPTFVNTTTNQQIQVDATLGFAEGEWSTPSDVYEGKAITINDAPAEAPLASFQLDGETSQNGTPTPSAPVAVQTVTGENVVQICGKNLFNKDKATAHFFYNSSGGTTSDPSNNYVNQSIPVSEKITIKAASKTGSPNVRFCEYKEDGTFISRTLINALESTVIVNSNTAKIIVSVDAGPNNYFTNLQIESGSTATAYEPYQGQSYEVNLGKNLFDKDNYTDQTGHYIGGSGKWTSSGATDHYFVFRVEPNTTYTFSKNVQTSNNRFRVGISPGVPTDGSTFPVWGGGDTATEITLTTASDSKYAYVYYSVTTNVEEAIQSLQIEVGSQKTSYAAYFTPIELCKIGDYQDYIYPSGGKWYMHEAVEKIVFDGSNDENWTRQPGNRTDIALSDAVRGSATNNPILSNLYKAVFAIADGNIFLSGASSSLGIIDTTNATTLENWRAYLSANNLKVYYALATPTDTEITNAALITQLEAVLGGRTYAGVNNITTITPNEQGTLEISFMTEKSQDRRDVIVIDSRMRTITLNGTDAYHLLAEGSEFPILSPGENKLLLRSDTPGDNGYAEVNYKQGYLSI